ncbi:MAG: alpha-amylase family glycosyl hydrolase, partial [Gemmataceae bacterium]
DLQTYHGYGIQNFLEIDPRFGTRQDLRDLVDAAHDRGMYVILDVIFNHTGNNFFYRDEITGEARETMPFRGDPPYQILGWRDKNGQCATRPIDIEDGVWPIEFQNPDWYARRGSIGRWEAGPGEDPLSPSVEYRRGDFFDLKDLDTENPQALGALALAYIYWIALSDCDGFRIDALKHVSRMASRRFCGWVREYAVSIGKENFLLTGEITDAQMAVDYLEVPGLNLGAALDITGTPTALAGMVKGQVDPAAFMSAYADNTPGGLYRRVGVYYISVVDDHDMSCRPRKERFAANNSIPARYEQSAHLVGVQLTIPTIPSIYYGTEQAFDGNEGYHDYTIDARRFGEDRYIREDMFGGPFGAFCTRGCHFFDPNHPTYRRIAALARVRNRKDSVGLALRRGTAYGREVCRDGQTFAMAVPRGEVVAWALLMFNREVTVALNTHGAEPRGADVTVDSFLNPAGTHLRVLYRGDWSDEQLANPPEDETVPVTHHPDGRASVRVDLPPAGMILLTRTTELVPRPEMMHGGPRSS